MIRTRNVSTQGRFSCPDEAPHSGYRLVEERWGGGEKGKGPLNSLARSSRPSTDQAISKYRRYKATWTGAATKTEWRKKSLDGMNIKMKVIVWSTADPVRTLTVSGSRPDGRLRNENRLAPQCGGVLGDQVWR
ncbi:hypothetical protein An08g06110 [Aspergillus niger]|uniref:Uncharacterized protein n=2 Tax=Aspergillus niger TaxID=5061 RepID=A2QRH9_ASPNC|nr:hypothetical protein An08g06110 [Aspergillus niger]CAK45580.1 hypothetical protein An08g06110 [Aspergillus niger]